MQDQNSYSAEDAGTGFVFTRDCQVTYGSKEIYTEFQINKSTTSEEKLKAEDFNVNNGVASKTTICETATYTFTRLPANLEELKTIPLDTKFGPMAAGICAVASYQEKQGPDMMYKHPIFDMFDWINGPKFEVSNVSRSGIYYSLKASLATGRLAYFEGAKPSNGYTPTQPYTFTLVHGPYYIPAKDQDINYGTTPERHMILISFEGDDAQRYMDVWHSSDGNWYCWDDSWKHLIAGMKPSSTW